jgi:SAM-dependent methyltransferase
MSSIPQLSPRLARIVEALPLRTGLRVLEIGGAPGTAARVVAAQVAPGCVHVIDRSERGVAAIRRSAADQIAAGLLSVECVAVEEFVLAADAPRFDLVFANRVGALDGRHPELGRAARERITAALAPGGVVYVDGHLVTW